MERFYITPQKLDKLIAELVDRADVFVPVKSEETFSFCKLEGDYSIEKNFNPIRATQPVKSILSPARFKVATYPKKSTDDPTAAIGKKDIILISAKACDLHSIRSIDVVFREGDFQDPFYKALRDKTVFISSDCTAFSQDCFCTLFENAPYSEDGFDLNLSQVMGGFILEVGTEKGRELIRDCRSYFQDVSDRQLEKRNEQRTRLRDQIAENVKNLGIAVKTSLQDDVRRNMESYIWEEKALACVECGACTNICPTCHCFLLYDQKGAEEFERIKIWDSCQYRSFAMVAGGANPCARRRERLRNRYIKKFDFYQENFGFYACVGCGRCSQACIGKIDIKEVLKVITESETKPQSAGSGK